jgi:outer membrane lipoprotein-sorting protein
LGWGEVRILITFFLAVAGLASVTRGADSVRDLVRIHTEATGGQARVAALKTLRATGVVRSGTGELKFVLLAARPNRIRTEVTSGLQTITQGWDGENEPWSADTKTRRVTKLFGLSAADFKVDAEFDDPLLKGGDKRQIALDYAGKVTMEGRDYIKVVVTQNFTETSFVYLDATTYLIARRDVVRRRKNGERLIRTDYSDFRAVAGVILPHRLVVSEEGKRIHETVIDRIEPNVELPDGVFKPPVVVTK